MKYTINYEFGEAVLYTPSKNWKDRFYTLANQCFGIRKSIGEVKLMLKIDIGPSDVVKGEYERLEHNGDVIIWDEHGEKIISEWD